MDHGPVPQDGEVKRGTVERDQLGAQLGNAIHECRYECLLRALLDVRRPRRTAQWCSSRSWIGLRADLLLTLMLLKHWLRDDTLPIPPKSLMTLWI
jgi:hypothetical protein